MNDDIISKLFSEVVCSGLLRLILVLQSNMNYVIYYEKQLYIISISINE